MPITESEVRNLARLKDAMKEVSKELAWRLADIVWDAVQIGKEGASEEYKQGLDELIQR